MEVLGRGQRRPGEDVAVAVRDPVPGHLRGGGHQGIPELGVPVHDTGPDRPFAHLRDNGGEILVDRCDLRAGSARGRSRFLPTLLPALAQLHSEESGVRPEGRDGPGHLTAKRSGGGRSGGHVAPP